MLHRTQPQCIYCLSTASYSHFAPELGRRCSTEQRRAFRHPTGGGGPLGRAESTSIPTQRPPHSEPLFPVKPRYIHSFAFWQQILRWPVLQSFGVVLQSFVRLRPSAHKAPTARIFLIPGPVHIFLPSEKKRGED